MLYIVATPIGNLQDITYRAIDTLKKVDLILCEDTRKSKVLLKTYQIETPLKSFHKFSEKKEEEKIIAALKRGENIALISDAGTPGISDPGGQLIERCKNENLPITSIPGPCAPIVALTLSGFHETPFQFIGFLSKKLSERKAQLIDALFYPGVTIFFESPNRIQSTLKEIENLGPSHQIAIAREMTKIHEECIRGIARDLSKQTYRGELVVMLNGFAYSKIDLGPKEHVAYLMKTYDLDKHEAIKLSAKLKNVSKKEIYDHNLQKKKE